MIAIVTDSTVCIPEKEAEELGIHLVSNTYSLGEQVYLESFSDCNGAFERLVFHEPEKWRTAQVSVLAFMQAFEDLIKRGREVLCLVISSRLSGAYSSACVAAKEFSSDRIAVVDSLSTAGGLWLLAKKARVLATKGLSLCEIAKHIEALREKVGIVFSVDDMSALRRSGRLGVVPQSVGTMLNIRPILMCIRGAVVARGLVRGRHARVQAMVDKMPANVKEIIIQYMGEHEESEPLYQGVKKRFPDIDIQVGRLGPVLGVHLGPGVLSVSWMCE